MSINSDEALPLLSTRERTSYPDLTVGPIGSKNQDDNHEAFTTKRNISSFSGVFVLAGIIIGSGIFISPNGVFVAANNSVGVTLLIWLFGGVVAMLSTLCYCELATSIPESGSDYTYLSYAYTPALGFLLPWMYTFVPCSDAALVLTFAQYAVEPFFVGSKPPELALKLVAICLLFFITAINMCSVRWAVRLQVLLSWFKFIAISAVVISAIVFCIGDNSVAKHNFAGAFNKKEMEGITILTLSRSFYQVMFSYDGWNSLCQITEEIQEPGKTIPKASIAAVAIVTLTYVIINCGYFLVLSADEMTSSKIVALPFALKAMGGASWIVPVAVCLCTAGSYSGGVLTSGRSSYVAARRGHFPRIFAMLHINQFTPSPALFLNTIGSIVLIGIGQFNTLIDTFGFVTWTFIGFSTLSVLVLRVRRPDLVRPYKVPTLIPILMILISLLFVILPVISNPHFLYAYAICFFALGELFYFVFVYKGYTIPYYLKSTLFLQKLFLVAPEERTVLD